MFKSLQTVNPLQPTSIRAPGTGRARYYKGALTVFSNGGTRVMSVRFKARGPRGNGYTANLLKLSATKYRFRLYAADDTRLNTITEEDAVAPPNVIENLVDSINGNNTFKTYITCQFFNETTAAMSDSINVGDGQKLRGGA
tara:strand:+ start:327 stop:749 length:423 start_codon:yes stop_codon:yes gene_type:complete